MDHQTSRQFEDHPGNNDAASDSDGAGSGAVRQTPRKRRRIGLACERCRAKKSRCDGTQPVCTMCRAAGYDCVYRMPAGAQSGSRPSFSAGDGQNYDLTNRVLAMEERMRRLEQGSIVRGPTPASTITEQQIIPENVGPSDSLSVGAAPGMFISDSPNDERPESSVDGMGVIAFADEQDSGYFGPSSNMAFMRHISNAIVATRDPTFSSAEVSNEVDTSIMSTSQTAVPAPQQQSVRPGLRLYALPVESELLELAESYFHNTGLLFPYVHSGSFYSTYAQVKEAGFRTMRMSWLALCNMVLANSMCSRVDDSMSVNKRLAASDVFYQRAVGLSRQRNLQGANLEVVQYLLLMTQYLQGSHRSSQTYAVHGQAVKLALQLGLQSEEVSRRFSPLEREMRKRTWHACVLIDMNLGMTFGRPLSIPFGYNLLGLPQNGDATSGHFIPGSDAALSVSFFIQTIKLYKITSRTIELLYGHNLGCGSPVPVSSTLCHILSLEEDLTSWTSSLPAQLELRKNVRTAGIISSTSTNDRLRTILTLRYLNSRGLLHRPIVMKLLDNCGRGEGSFGGSQWMTHKRMGWSSVMCSLECAMEIIAIIHGLGGRKTVLGAWWFSLYYTFNSALVIFAVWLLCADDYHNNSGLCTVETFEQMRVSLTMAVNALPMLDAGNAIVDRCYSYLKKLVAMDLLKSPGAATETPSRLDQHPVSMGNNMRMYGTPNGNLNMERPEVSMGLSPFQNYQPFSGAQGWDLGEMEMGQFITESNLDFLNDLSGLGVHPQQ